MQYHATAGPGPQSFQAGPRCSPRSSDHKACQAQCSPPQLASENIRSNRPPRSVGRGRRACLETVCRPQAACQQPLSRPPTARRGSRDLLPPALSSLVEALLHSEYSDVCTGRVRASSTMSIRFGTDAPESTAEHIATMCSPSSQLQRHSKRTPKRSSAMFRLSQPSPFVLP